MPVSAAELTGLLVAGGLTLLLAGGILVAGRSRGSARVSWSAFLAFAVTLAIGLVALVAISRRAGMLVPILSLLAGAAFTYAYAGVVRAREWVAPGPTKAQFIRVLAVLCGLQLLGASAFGLAVLFDVL